jgi:hypothetical protein
MEATIIRQRDTKTRWHQALFIAVVAVALIVGAAMLPFLPGRYDPLALSLSMAATVVCLGSLLLVPIAVTGLLPGRRYVSAKMALAAATVIAAAAALSTAAIGSVSAGTVIMALWVVWLVHLWRRLRAAERGDTALTRAWPVVFVVVPLVLAAARLTLVPAASEWSRDRAIANASQIIADIEQFHERTGAYPVALNSLWPDYHPGIVGIERYRYEPSGDVYNLYFEQPSTNPAREIVMYNPRGQQDFSSHAFDLLQLSPEEIRRQRGYFKAEKLPRANWTRFLFD